jgi:hypothetical protein
VKPIAVPQQDAIEVWLDEDGDIVVRQEDKYEASIVLVRPEHAQLLIDALVEVLHDWQQAQGNA